MPVGDISEKVLPQNYFLQRFAKTTVLIYSTDFSDIIMLEQGEIVLMYLDPPYVNAD